MFWSPLILPYGDNIDRGNKRPWATWLIVGVTLLAFVATRAVVLQGESVSTLWQLLFLENYDNKDWLYLTFGFIPSQLAALSVSETAARMLGSIFIHDSLQHLAANMFFFWVVGRSVESRLNSWLFLALYLLGGLLGVAAQYGVDTASSAVIVGASGAVWTVAAFYLLTFRQARVRPLIVAPIWNIPVAIPNSLPFWMLLVVSQVVQSAWGFALRYAQYSASPGIEFSSTGSSVGYFAHLGGALLGVAYYLYLRRQAGWNTPESVKILEPARHPVWVYTVSYFLVTILLASSLYWQAVALRGDAIEIGFDNSGKQDRALLQAQSSSWRTLMENNSNIS